MISPLVLERPGGWRSAAVAAALILPLLPAMPLALEAIRSGASAPGAAFWAGLSTCALVGLAVACAAWLVGLPLGVAAALYEVPGRRLLLALLALPLILPSLLPALGWSALGARLGPWAARALASPAGGFLVFAGSGVPLVLLASFAATLGVPPSQLDAARLGGGERAVLREAIRAAAPPALLMAGLAAILPQTDPAPGLVLGYRSAAAEVLTRSSALFDLPGAALQSVVLGLVVLLVALPLALPAAARLASPGLARAAGEPRRHRAPGLGVLLAAALATTVLAGLGLPLLGLAAPLVTAGPEISRPVGTALRTGADTLAYGLGAGTVATALAALLAVAVGRSAPLRRLALGACLVLFALPSSLSALGLVQIATAAPGWADPLLRSRLTVAAALGLRTFPVAAILMLRAWASLPASWAGAAAVHGVALNRYLGSVLAPALAPTAALSLLLTALLATADVGTVLLLHPPGHPSLPLALFTVMANAPEAYVASLGLLYLLIAGVALGAVWRLAAREAR